MKDRTVGTTGIAWLIRETSVGKKIRQQVRSLPKNLPLQSDLKVDKWE